MDDPFSGDTSLPEVELPEKGERMDWVRDRWWAALPLLVFLWILVSVIVFPIVGLVIGSFVGATLAAPVLGLAAAAAIGHRWGLLEPVDEARRGAPLWARLIVPIPVFAVLWLLFFVAVGSIVDGFVAIAGVATVLALAVTGAGAWMLGLYSGLTQTVRESSPGARLAMLTAAGVLIGLTVFGSVVAATDNVPVALAALVPSGLVGAVALAWLLDWGEDAHETIASWHFGTRLGAFLVLEALLTLYIALLVGGFVTDARFAYAIAVVAGLAVLVPATVWVNTWRDAWQAFLDLGEDNRVLVLLPTFPLAAALVFGLIVVLTDSFEAAYIASVPAGVAALVALGYPLGVTQRIPPVVRRRNLPARSGILVGAFALLSVYAYFAIALVIPNTVEGNVQISLVAGMAFAGLVLAAVTRAFDLDRGLGEEFESYGAPAEAAVLVVVFAASLALAFLAIALTTGDIRLAFLVSVVVAAGLNYLIAHQTGLVESMRVLVGEVPWYGDLVLLGAAFLGAALYGTLALGLFLSNVAVALAFGVVVGLAAVVGLSQDLAIGEDVMASAEDEAPARAVVLVLAFLGGFLGGLYIAAAALSAAGSDLFGFPLFVALLTGSGATIGLARARNWDRDLLGRLRSRTDKLKVATILAIWLAVGIGTGFAFTMLPVDAADLGIGSGPGVPLVVALAAGLVVWVWLPALLFQAVRVERGPGQATLETRDRSRALASAGWGLLTFAVVLVVVLSVLDSPVVGVGSAVAVGYLVALVISTQRRRSAGDDT